jgi:hypothetical protein
MPVLSGVVRALVLRLLSWCACCPGALVVLVVGCDLVLRNAVLFLVDWWRPVPCCSLLRASLPLGALDGGPGGARARGAPRPRQGSGTRVACIRAASCAATTGVVAFASSRSFITITIYYKYLVHVVIPLATCLRNGYAIPLGYAEFSVLKEMWVKNGLTKGQLDAGRPHVGHSGRA